MIYNEKAIVISTKEIAFNTYETKLQSPQITNSARPGQFINILPSIDWNNIMRRPMSISSQENDKIGIIFKVVGEGTEIMKNWEINDEIDIIGPLGNYWSNYKDFLPILIGGGVGIAPIINLHNMLNKIGVGHSLIMGAQTKKDHFIEHKPNDKIYISTDDGSLGISGSSFLITSLPNNELVILLF